MRALLERSGCNINNLDQTYFIKYDGVLKTHVAIHVDDLILTGENDNLINIVKNEL